MLREPGKGRINKQYVSKLPETSRKSNAENVRDSRMRGAKGKSGGSEERKEEKRTGEGGRGKDSCCMCERGGKEEHAESRGMIFTCRPPDGFMIIDELGTRHGENK